MTELNLDDEKEDKAMEDLENKENENELPKAMRYEYYIHYLGQDRRNDRWVTEHFLKLDPVEIAAQDTEFTQKKEEE